MISRTGLYAESHGIIGNVWLVFRVSMVIDPVDALEFLGSCDEDRVSLQ
jgi:hypothetical protein